MDSAHSAIDDLSHDGIRAWLDRALHGQESLPRLTPDESPHLGILRREKTLKPATRDSLRDGCAQLVRLFCAGMPAETAWVEELLRLAAAFKNAETVQLLAQFARRFPQLPGIPLDIRFAVLSALVDTPPPQSPEFWQVVLEQDPEQYASLALSGVLATHPAQAIAMLPRMPDIEHIGEAAALKLELAWDDLPPRNRFRFVQRIEAILLQCGPRIAGPVQAWTESKEQPPAANANPTLRDALSQLLGAESSPKTRTPRLCSAA